MRAIAVQDPTFAEFVEGLQENKPVVVIGDLNCAPQPIDIHAPSRNLKSAGFTPEERESFARNLIDRGLVDAFRRQHPDIAGLYHSCRHLASIE